MGGRTIAFAGWGIDVKSPYYISKQGWTDFEGLLGAKRYDCTVEHDGNNTRINFNRPGYNVPQI